MTSGVSHFNRCESSGVQTRRFQVCNRLLTHYGIRVHGHRLLDNDRDPHVLLGSGPSHNSRVPPSAN